MSGRWSTKPGNSIAKFYLCLLENISNILTANQQLRVEHWSSIVVRSFDCTVSSLSHLLIEESWHFAWAICSVSILEIASLPQVDLVENIFCEWAFLSKIIVHYATRLAGMASDQLRSDMTRPKKSGFGLKKKAGKLNNQFSRFIGLSKIFLGQHHTVLGSANCGPSVHVA